jgi:hypothetical protein
VSHRAPNFPQPPRYYPLNLPLRLQRFSLGTLDRFIQFERPAECPITPGEPLAGPPPEPMFEFNTVGELYDRIRNGFVQHPNFVIGDPDRQVGQDLVAFPDLIRVCKSADAVRAIKLITRQGEGVKQKHDDCHFEIFRNIRREYLTELAAAENLAAQDFSKGGTGISKYKPVRPAISDPVAGDVLYLGVSGANQLTDHDTVKFAHCFDLIYNHMLRMLQYVFDNTPGHDVLLPAFGQGAQEAMTAVLKPLGEALTLMKAGPEYENQTAGPGFALARYIALPADPLRASIVNAERLRELSTTLLRLAKRTEIAQVASAATNLEVMADRFDDLRAQISGTRPRRRKNASS